MSSIQSIVQGTDAVIYRVGPLVETPTARPKPTVARFLLDGPVLPLVTDTIWIAEAFRGAVMSHFGAWCRKRPPADVEQFRREDRSAGYASPVLSGKDSSGRSLTGHDHAYYLPTAENDPTRLDHLTLYAASGFGTHEVAALNGLRQLAWQDQEPLRVQLVGLGRPDDFRCPLFGPARLWESATPFVVSRHVKKRGQKKDPPDCHGLRRPAALRGPRPCRRKPTLAPAPSHPCGRRPAHLYSSGACGPHPSVPSAPVSSPAAANPATTERVVRRPRFAWSSTARCRGRCVWATLAHFGLGLFLPAE